MTKREKVIRGAEVHSSEESCSMCPYKGEELCTTELFKDVIASLKEQEVHRDGYWIEDAKTYPGAGLSNYICSNCGKTGGTWIKHIAPGRTFPWCPFCGSNMSREAVKWDD